MGFRLHFENYIAMHEHLDSLSLLLLVYLFLETSVGSASVGGMVGVGLLVWSGWDVPAGTSGDPLVWSGWDVPVMLVWSGCWVIQTAWCGRPLGTPLVWEALWEWDCWSFQGGMCLFSNL